MLNLKKSNQEIRDLLQNSNIATKILLYFSTQTIGADYDPYEKTYTYTNLNPITIRGYVRDIKPESLVWKQYGLAEVGAKEIICDETYAESFRLCNKIEIDGDVFQVYKENVGNRHLITKRPLKLIKVVVKKAE